MASIGISLNNLNISVNSLPWVHAVTIQRRSLAPVRYTACAFKEVVNHFSKRHDQKK